MFLLFFVPVKSFTQTKTISFTYDDAGNMIAKTISLGTTLKSSSPSSTEEAARTTPMSDSDNEMINDATFDSKLIRIFPNPTKGIIKIELPQPGDDDSYFQISVYDPGGRQVFKKDRESTISIIDLSSGSAGVYTLQIKNGNISSVWKIIKQ